MWIYFSRRDTKFCVTTNRCYRIHYIFTMLKSHIICCCLLVCCLFFLPKKSFAQEPTYLHYTLEDGLPSMQIYNIIQDQKGFIWLATSMGVSRFDGQTFTNYSTAQGLPDNHIWDIKEDLVKERLYLLKPPDTLAFIHEEKLYPLSFSQNLSPNSPLAQSGDIIIDFKTSLLLYSDSLGQNILPNQKKYFRQAISCQLDEDETNMWLGTWGAGAFFCQNYQSEAIQVQQFLPKKIITAILKDQEGNYWFATLDEGVFLLTNKNVQSYSFPNNDVQSVIQDSVGNIWVGSSKASISKIDDGGNIRHFSQELSGNNYNRVNAILLDYQQNKWLGTDEGLHVVDSSGNWVLLDVTAVKSLLEVDTNLIWVGKYRYPVLLDTYEGNVVDTLALNQVSSLCQDRNSRLWVGTMTGLYHRDKGQDTLFFWHKRGRSLFNNITDLAIDNLNRLWIATSGYGVFILKEDRWLAIQQIHGLSSNTVHAIFIDKKNTAWIATNKGLNRLQLDNIQQEGLQIKTFTHLDGLPSNHVNDVWVNGDSVWVATLKGLAFFRPSTMEQQSIAPPIYIRNVQIAYTDTAIQKEYELAHYQNNIKIDFQGLSYQSAGKLRYQYKMIGIDTAWIMTHIPTVQYPTLPSGDYRFEVAAMDKDGVLSHQAQALTFRIALPFWKTWWFLIGMALLGAISLIFVVYWIIRYFKERGELQRRMMASEQMALRAQMNPHFIFNSLNSIQYFITENDKRSANLYLSVFAQLIRKVLDSSQKASIPLEDELEYLDLYLQIESLRFKGKFEYELHTAPDVEIDEVNIPPMLIQPYVENALRHGLLQKKEGERLLSIHFGQIDDLLICKIEDNGIGRREASLLKSQRPEAAHKGIGTTNPKERLDILNQMMKRPIRVQIIDLRDDKHLPNGTRVTIRIPVL